MAAYESRRITVSNGFVGTRCSSTFPWRHRPPSDVPHHGSVTHKKVHDVPPRIHLALQHPNQKKSTKGKTTKTSIRWLPTSPRLGFRHFRGHDPAPATRKRRCSPCKKTHLLGILGFIMPPPLGKKTTRPSTTKYEHGEGVLEFLKQAAKIGYTLSKDPKYKRMGALGAQGHYQRNYTPLEV